MAPWHMVHAWYFCDWLCAGPMGGCEGTLLIARVWHCRHNRFTWLTFSSRGLVEPWGTWQLVG